MSAELALLPRFIRAKQAPAYLGMCRSVFDAEVRPHIREFPIGKQGIAFDRHELDEWADAYVARKSIEKTANQDNNRPRSERQGKKQGEMPWPKKLSPASSKCRTASGRSTKNTEENEFKRVLALVTAPKLSNT
ncbi:hypothetical protein [Pseudomonas sp. URMO17WK12:I12]|uniref:hypothetical protein n=1 Tax=Pseudomonas sp. URMO17WK12:I12 TaxID=1259797 RepID=UPI00210EA5DF|nr:hypothetical protein [Pseudomonas sp. URMO17WK12:I12]